MAVTGKQRGARMRPRSPRSPALALARPPVARREPGSQERGAMWGAECQAVGNGARAFFFQSPAPMGVPGARPARVEVRRGRVGVREGVPGPGRSGAGVRRRGEGGRAGFALRARPPPPRPPPRDSSASAAHARSTHAPPQRARARSTPQAPNVSLPRRGRARKRARHPAKSDVVRPPAAPLDRKRRVSPCPAQNLTSTRARRPCGSRFPSRARKTPRRR